MEVSIDHGQARVASHRLANLSDTIFGVAMTLLATTLLPLAQSPGESAIALLLSARGELAAVAFSFAISAAYWLVQSRRLALTATVSGPQILFTLVFLFLIVLLPISTELSGRFGETQRMVAIYGSHLTLIALVNLILWLELGRSVGVKTQIIQSGLAFGLFLSGSAIGLYHPGLAKYVWLAVFAAAPIGRRLVPLRTAA